ncbi:MAG: hypothetical protein H6541_05240 [Lentimicrobiaceae bacterium]|nr:hypothetical protein [Lentimicrobiaceae bacterium]HPG32943.1 hypothetical protein [Lentimicrobium sp.]
MTGKKFLYWAVRFIVLLILYYVFFFLGAQAVASLMPPTMSEPGLVGMGTGMLIVGVAHTCMIMALILSSRWKGLKLMLSLALAYYGAVTFVMQIETWYFLSDITVNPGLLARLFIMGLPVAFIYIPLAVWILGKARGQNTDNERDIRFMPAGQWLWKLGVIAISYVCLYWLAGYYIAWQNPELRAFYGSPGDILPFWTHTIQTLSNDPGLFPFQILRAMIWTVCAWVVIRNSKLNIWWTALLVGCFFSVPQNLGHIMENPILPLASVRLSHFIETATSTFVFGVIIVLLLYRRHYTFSDLWEFKAD